MRLAPSLLYQLILMPLPQILAFAGSTRTDSLNKKLIHLAAEAAREAGAQVTFVDLRDLALPLYDGDLETSQGLPEGAKKLKALMQASDGFLIATPEYNGSVSGVLKNAIDWVSRSESDDEPSLVAFRGKTAALLAASPGGVGGMRALIHLRAILGHVGMLLLPDQLTLASAGEAFDEAGQLKDPRKVRQVKSVAGKLVEFLARQKA